MNKRLGVRLCRVLFDNHKQWLLSVSCLLASVCIWQSGGQGLVVLVEGPAELDPSCGHGCAHSGWHSRGPLVAPQEGTTRPLHSTPEGGWGGNKPNILQLEGGRKEDESMNTWKGPSWSQVMEAQAMEKGAARQNLA